jgi:hypothetical protein
MRLAVRKRGISRPGEIHLRIVEVMKRFPDGVSGGQIRQELEKAGLRPEDQTHLDRRKRAEQWRLCYREMAARPVCCGRLPARRSM